MSLRILVCGGRRYRNYTAVTRELVKFAGDVEIAHGGANGADGMAGYFAQLQGWPVRIFPAEWDKHGKAAGAIRNSLMLREFKPDLVIAFPGGRGTADMVAKARKAGVTVIEVPA